MRQGQADPTTPLSAPPDPPSMATILRAAALSLLPLAGFVQSADAHAFLLDTNPADSGRLNVSPPDIRLVFNEAVTPIRLDLLDATGRPVPDAGPVVAQGAILRLPVPRPLAKGAYTISYRVTSADGHPAAGTIVFGVGVSPVDGAVGETDVSEADVSETDLGQEDAAALVLASLRALHFASLLAGTGGGLFLALVSGRWSALNRKLRPGLCLLLLVAGVSAMLLVGLTGVVLNGAGLMTIASAAAWSSGWVSSVGASAATALLALLVSATGLALEADRRMGGALLVVGALLAALSLAMTGHAATAPPRWLSAPLVALHTLMAAYWIGALWPLSVALRHEPLGNAARLTRRFSRFAMAGVAFLIAAGAVLSVLQIRHPAAVLDSGYGRLWLAKMVVVGGLLALAAFNRLRLTPALDRSGSSAAAALRRGVGWEVALAAIILLVTSAFSLTPPPRASQPPTTVEDEAPPQAGYVASITRGDLMALIEVTPGTPGANRLRARITGTDGHAAQPLDATVEWSGPGAPAARRQPTITPDGQLAADGLAMPTAGRWTVSLSLRAADGGPVVFQTEIPIRAATSAGGLDKEMTP